MDQAKANINLKEGLIQLEGPVDFVREYLNRFATKGLQSISKKVKVTPAEEGVEVRQNKRRRTRRISAVKAVRAEARAGFFNEARSTEETKLRLAEKGVDFSKNSIRIGLNRLIEAGRLSRSGVARNSRYQSTTSQPPRTSSQT